MPTVEDGTTAQASPMVYVPPARQMTPEQLEGQLVETGMNGPFLADMLSAMTAHERCGRHLYRSVAGRTNNPVLKARYEEFGAETEDHVRKLSEIIVTFGGDPLYVSPYARAVEGMGTKTLEATFLLSGSVDAMTSEMVMLDAVVLAETIDRANWVTLATVVEKLPSALKAHVGPIVEEVLEEEDDHLGWATSMRQRMVMLQAESSMMAAMGAKAEEIIERVRSFITD